MLGKLNSLTLIGLNAEKVIIEVDLHFGMPKVKIVGLPDAAIQESRERVHSAIKHSGFTFPSKVVVVNLAPADLRKQGPRFDLPIALGILHASKQLFLPNNLENTAFIGELAFTGKLREISGVLPTVDEAKKQGFREIFIPAQNAIEASLIEGISVYPVNSLKEICDHFSRKKLILPLKKQDCKKPTETISDSDFSHVKGNETAKRALEIAAAGGHNVLLSGPPGSGKTMLAKAFTTILPKMNIDESLEVTKIYSIAGLTNKKTPIISQRPFRAIHHTASGVAIVGGGNPPKPGEISLAHKGVLFLDELPEFPQKTLEVLRQPLEDGQITISRSSGSCTFPAQIMFIGAMNPCPCGYYGDDQKDCCCSPMQISKYQNRLSGPLLDRIDIHLQVPRIPFEKLSSLNAGETSAQIRIRVEKSREIQEQRFKNEKILTNAEMSSAMVKKFCVLDEDCRNLLKTAVTQMHLSGRAFYRILKLSRTIADLAEEKDIKLSHIAEALSFREQN